MNITVECETFREQLQAYLDEALDETARHEWRQHLCGCAVCRQWATASEPTLVFTAMEVAEADPQQVEACVGRVTALIHHERLQRRLRPSRRPWLAVAAAVLLVIAAGVMWRLLPGPAGPTSDLPISSADSETTPPAPPEVEVDMDGEGVQIYRFASDQDENTAVVYVVNPALES